jgi:endonuclease YncB( thermonuclease family)
MNLRRTATVLLIGSFIGFSTTCGSLWFGGHGLAEAAVEPLRGIAGEVHSGDTFALGDARIRLWSLDAPELDQPGELLARDRLADIIEGRSLICGRLGADHGRVVARCVTDMGRDPAREMVRAGMAQDWPRFSRGEYAEDQEAAKRRQAGLWAGEIRPPWEWRRKGG